MTEYTFPIWLGITGEPHVVGEDKLVGADGKKPLALAIPTVYGEVFIPVPDNDEGKRMTDFMIGVLSLPLRLTKEDETE